MARHGKGCEMGTISNAMLGLAVAGSLSVLSAFESRQGQAVRKISNTDRQGSAEGLVIAGFSRLRSAASGVKLIRRLADLKFRPRAPANLYNRVVRADSIPTQGPK